jgi:hypothetical protein
MEQHLSEEQIDSFALGRLDENAVLHFMICDECMKQLDRTIDFIKCLRVAAGEGATSANCDQGRSWAS